MSDDNKSKLIEDFKINWLKYNLSCKRSPSQSNITPENKNYNDHEQLLMKRVKNILKDGTLHDKILLYYIINNNVNDLLSEITKIEKKVTKAGNKNNTISLCKIELI